MILHTVNKSSFEHNTFDRCLAYADGTSAIVLIEDGVYCGLNASLSTERIEQLSKGVQLYGLSVDIDARGLRDGMHPLLQIIDDRSFVRLCTQFDSIQTWF